MINGIKSSADLIESWEQLMVYFAVHIFYSFQHGFDFATSIQGILGRMNNGREDSSCINYLVCCSDKIPNRNPFKEQD